MNYFAFIFSVPPIGYKVWCFSNVYTTSGIIVVASMGYIGDSQFLIVNFLLAIHLCNVFQLIGKHCERLIHLNKYQGCTDFYHKQE